jgi:putative transcriptional regulator
MTIHLRLKEIMEARGLTAKELAARTHISEAAISEWRTNKVVRISLATLNTLCVALECEPGDMIVKRPDK